MKAIDDGLEWMPKSVWGPIKWKELHTRGLIRRSMRGEKKWFADFIKGLPCPKCRNHFEEFIANNPPDFRSRPSFFTWTVKAHNAVNRKTGKRRVRIGHARKIHRITPDLEPR